MELYPIKIETGRSICKWSGVLSFIFYLACLSLDSCIGCLRKRCYSSNITSIYDIAFSFWVLLSLLKRNSICCSCSDRFDYESSQAHPKAAIGIRNRTMIDRSDMVVCYIERKSGGAYRAVRYAAVQGKVIINLYNYNCGLFAKA